MKTITIHPSVLDAKVAARNRVSRLAKAQHPAMLAALAPFVGKKILNQGATLCAKVRAELPKDNCAGQGASADQWFYTVSTYNLRVQFQVQECAKKKLEWHSENWPRAEASVHLAEITNGVLLKLADPATCLGHLREDYSAVGVLAARERLNAAQKALDAAKDELHGFGEYDNQ